MAIEQFKAFKPRPDSIALIAFCNTIIKRYAGQGLRLTLRQLYYQCVSTNVLTNTERSYQNLSSLVSKARLGGLMDWDAIEDRIRRPESPSEFRDINHLVDVAIRSYRLPRWKDQHNYVELWVEKDALAGVLSPIARQYHITLMVNRGYSSQSAMYESAERFREEQGRKDCFLFYLGDHDPSGEDMVRDIKSRMEMFNILVDVQKLALTMAQVNHYKPPPNPAKLTDPRSDAYVKKHGAHSWEVDALPPQVLAQIIRTALDGVTDKKKMQRIAQLEELDKDALREAAKKIVVAAQRRPKAGGPKVPNIFDTDEEEDSEDDDEQEDEE